MLSFLPGKGHQAPALYNALPKPLVPIGDEHSILEIALHQLAQCDFDRVTLAIGHFGELIRSYIGDGSRGASTSTTASRRKRRWARWGLSADSRPAARPVPGHERRRTHDLDYADLMLRHASSDAPVTVATYQREVRIDYGVLTTRDAQVVQFTEKPTIDYRVSMGVYACSKHALAPYTPGLPFGFDELVLDMLARNTPPQEYAFGATGSTSAARGLRQGQRRIRPHPGSLLRGSRRCAHDHRCERVPRRARAAPGVGGRGGGADGGAFPSCLIRPATGSSTLPGRSAGSRR